MAKKNKGNNKGSYNNQNQGQSMNRQNYVNPVDAENCTAQQSDATNKKGQTNKSKSTGMQG